MLILKSSGGLNFEGQSVALPTEQMGEFIMANISSECAVEGAAIRDLLRVMMPVEDFVRDYFLEEYHSVSAIISAVQAEKKIERVEFYKEMIIDGDGFVDLVAKVDIVEGESGVDFLKDAPVVLSDRLRVNDFSGGGQWPELKARFTLLEVMEGVFVELAHSVQSGQGESGRTWLQEQDRAV